MKLKLLTLMFFLAFSHSIKSQNWQYSPIAHVESGITTWLISHAQLCSYLTIQLNENLDISGNITECTFVQIAGIYHLEGTGQGSNEDETRNIRMSLYLDQDNNLSLDYTSGGTTETCTGDPCSKCEFASGGGCTCTRTTSSTSGHDGKCNHSVTKSLATSVVH